MTSNSPPIRAVALMVVTAIAYGFFGFLLTRLIGGDSPLFDPDFFWALEAGRWSLENGALIDRNTFSYTAPDAPWIFHEWAYGLILALGYDWLGLRIAWVVTACSAIATTVLFTATTLGDRREGTAVWATLGALCCWFVSVPALALSRPTYVSWWCPLALLLLARREASWAVIAATTAVQLCWTGLHGSFIVGWALLALLGWERRWLWGVLALSAGLALFNPYGPALLGLVGQYASGTGAAAVALAEVREFLPLWRQPFNPFEWLALGAVGTAGIVTLRERPNRAIATLGLTVLALAQARHVPLAVFVGVALSVEPLSKTRRFSTAMPSWSLWVPAVAGVLGVLTGLPEGLPPLQIRQDADFERAMERVDAGTHLYVPFGFAGPAIHLGRERGIEVFYDERNDCYPAEVGEAAFRLVNNADPHPVKTLERFGTTAALVPTGTASAAHFDAWEPEQVGGWTLYRAR